MDQAQRERICDDLRGAIKGELLFDPISCVLYSTDASLFQVEPVGIVAPRDEEDVQSLVRYAREHNVPLIPRGAGTGLAGEALGAAIILDMSRHFRSILEIGPDTVRVQPGAVHRNVNGLLAKTGRRIAPDPTSGVECTLGGMLATNASGARALRHGYTRDHVACLRLVLDTSEAVWVNSVPHEDVRNTEDRFGQIQYQIANLLERNDHLVRSCQPRTRFNRCGYLLDGVLTGQCLNLNRLLVGSEGTLGIFTEAVLRTIPLPRGRSLVLLGFDSLDAALRASALVLPSEPSACDLVDQRLLSLVRGRQAVMKSFLPVDAEAVLLVEYESDDEAGAAERARETVDRLVHTNRLALHARIACEESEIEQLWMIREAALPNLYGLRSGPQPVAIVEDVGVPVEELPRYLHGVQEILKRHETTASYLIHAGSGQVHTRPFLDLQKPEDVSRMWALAEEVHSFALELGGTISTQHGTGLSRTPWVARQYGQLYTVFREIKSIFDPRGIFNPGKIVGPDPGRPACPLRQSPASKTDGAAWQLGWSGGTVGQECGSCNGCGHCRTDAPGQRMCPVHRATHAEEASPRAGANLLRYLLREGNDPAALASDEVRELADACVNCRMCAIECPAHVNVCKLMLEIKAANVARHGLDRTDWTLSRTESFAALASVFAFAINYGLASRTVRWFLERFFGISRKRRMPTFASRSFLRRAMRRGWTRRPRKQRDRVAYFVDIFANYNDPSIAEATVAVLHHNGVEVYVPPGQRGCGMALLACGDVETAREVARHNVEILAEIAREGYPIVCSEPTAALMLRHDYPDLLDDPDTRLVASRVVELTAFLWDLHQQQKLRTDFKPIELAVGHHVPCHLKALGGPAAGPGLLALIPALRVHTIDVGCSGMAGTFGLKARNYGLSLEAGRSMLQELKRPRTLLGSTECSTCRLQIEDGAGKRTLHPVQYLALAYGLMPELARRLRQPIPALVLR